MTVAGPMGRPRGTVRRIGLALLAVVLFAGFCSLGMWQLQRRAWKLDLIAQVDQRAHLPPAPAPGAQRWDTMNTANDEYRHVVAAGEYRYDRQTLVQATTDYGSGYWVMTPLQLRQGETVLVNRGFVLPAWRKQRDQGGPAGPVEVTGLLRMSEPDFPILRTNDPAKDVWYSRDTRAIGVARGLGGMVAPYFIDAEKTAGSAPDPARAPVPGLTVLTFRNSHLVYALTWFAMAAMVIVGAAIVVRTRRGA